MRARKKSDIQSVQRGLREQILAPLRRPLISIGIFSFIVNILVLALPLYMMNIFDRVLTSLSIETLISLALMTTGLLVTMGFIDIQRSRALARIGLIIDTVVANRMIGAILRANLNARIHYGIMDEIDKIRTFLGGQGVVALFDIPFAPIYLAILFLMSPWLGYTALGFGVTVIAISLYLEWRSQNQERDTETSLKRVAYFAENSVRNAEVVTALGMADRVRDRWQAQREGLLKLQIQAQDMGAAGSGILKAANMVMQVFIAGVACYLVINEQLTSGALFAANILAGRMVMPIQYIVTAWKGYSAARDAFNTLSGLIGTFEPQKSDVVLPAPRQRLEVIKVSAIPPGSQDVVIKDVSFTAEAGEAIGVVGPSGSGKSTLARLILGLWPLRSGAIRLDGADVQSWPAEELGPHIGYVPQDVELLDGTVGENICRFGELDSDGIIAAARAVGIHDTILQLASGYDTRIKSQGGVLSGGQRQRVALARAIYGDPFLVVLDEPNSNMDEQGEADLIALIAELKSRGKIVILITHSRRLLVHVDKILMIKNGKSLRFASPAEFSAKAAEVAGPKPMKVV